MNKVFILDTNVLLEDVDAINALRNDDENTIVLPYSVIIELDRLKDKVDKAHIISQLISNIINDDKLIIIKRNDFEYNRDNCNDGSIIGDIKYYLDFSEKNGLSSENVIVISNDKIFRLRVIIEFNSKIKVQEYNNSKPFLSDTDIYTGYVRINNEDHTYIPNCFVLNDNKIWWEKTEEFIDNNELWKITPKTVYQNMAIQLLLDDDIKVVSLASPAGAGKTMLALAAAIQITQQNTTIKKEPEELILEDSNEPVITEAQVKKRGRKPKNRASQEKLKSKYKKIFVIRPTTIIGEELGFLPGDLNEKIDPYFRPIRDLILKLHDIRQCNRLFNDNDPKNGFDSRVIEFLPVTYLRGMNIENAIVIIDEVQNLSRSEVRTLLSRMGENVRCFLTGDPTQIDNKYLNQSNNGLNWVLRKFKGQREYAHITLKCPKSRGPITDLVIKTNL